MSFEIRDIATTIDLNLLTSHNSTSQEQGCAQVLAKISKQQELSPQEIMTCVQNLPLSDLVNLSAKITSLCASHHFHTCAITNVKSGRCSEDCKWCAQSQHYPTAVSEYDVKSPEVCQQEAHKAQSASVEMFSFVASGRRPNKSSFAKLLKAIDTVKQSEQIDLCASLGLATLEMLRELKAHGLTRYHCNLESSERFFPQLCTTHTFEQKIKTLKAAQEAGLQICSGGIIGMGETMQDRLDLALALRELGVPSVPINVLHPIAGTPLQDQAPLSGEEIIRSVALFRLTLPQADLRFAGGRDLMSPQLQKMCIAAGINAAIVGTLLTTSNTEAIQQDIAKLHSTKQNILKLTLPQSTERTRDVTTRNEITADTKSDLNASYEKNVAHDANKDSAPNTANDLSSQLKNFLELGDCTEPMPEDIMGLKLKFKEI